MYRIGQSSDIHPLVKNRLLILGGVTIPNELGLKGHSDGDALLHAIAEAIIGALGQGDLGKHFSDQNPQHKGMSSLVILEYTYQLMNDKNYHINNIDALIMIEKPKMAPFIPLMRANIAKALNCEPELINIKATRGERLGFIGREEGVMAQAVVLLKGNE